MKMLHSLMAKAVLILCMVQFTGLSKTSQQLVTEFTDILPPNTKARAAWLHRASDGKMSVYVVDSDSGVIRELTSPSLFPGGNRDFSWFHPPLITRDGSRVVFRENTGGTWYVINWDGSGLRSFPVSGSVPGGLYHNPSDNSDWIVHDGSGINRTNIDKPSQRVLLWNRSSLVWPGWFTVSGDGARVSMSQNNQIVGIAAVPNGTFITGDTLGCRVSLAPDNSYDFIFQTPFHKLIRMCDSNGVKKQDFTPNDSIIAWAKRTGVHNAGALQEHDCTRWSNHRDYITFYMNCTRVNPFIMRLSDQKWMYIADGLSVLGSADLCIMPRAEPPAAPPVIAAIPDIGCQAARPLQIVARIRGNPAPTITAQGLPPGVSVSSEVVQGDSAVFSGSPTTVGKYTVILAATNGLGNDLDTFSITVSMYNDTPKVDAGLDTTTRIGREFFLQGMASDDGIVDPELTIQWRLVSGSTTGATIANPASLTTAVEFSQTGNYRFQLRAGDGAVWAADTVLVRVLAPIPFTVLRPAVGSGITIGSTDSITWQIDPPASVVIFLSTDGGATEEPLTAAAIPAGQTSWIWRVPDTLALADSCLITVRTYDPPFKYAYSGLFSLGKTSVKPRSRATSPTSKPNLRFYTLDGRKWSPANATAIGTNGGTPKCIVVVDRSSGKATRVRKTVILRE